MNRNLFFLFAAWTVFLTISCSAPASKEEELQKLKQQHAELTDKIRALENEIGASTPVATVKMKEVVAEIVQPSVFNYFIETQGGVEAEENIMVSAKTPGVVTQVYVKEGEVVRMGMVLAQIDNSITIKAIEELKGSLDLAKTVYERQKSLWDQKIGTEIQFLTAKNNKESLERRLSTLMEQDELSRIRSSIDGTVDDVMIKAGETTSPGIPAMRIVNTNKLKVACNVSESYIKSISPGNEAIVNIGDNGRSFTGRVSFAGKNINPLSRTFGVEITVPSGTDARPGMSARIRINFKKVKEAIAVPVNLVQNLNGEQIVFVASEETGKWVAKKRPVTSGGVYDGKTEILSGLQAGDRVITVGYQGLNDGELIRL